MASAHLVPGGANFADSHRSPSGPGPSPLGDPGSDWLQASTAPLRSGFPAARGAGGRGENSLAVVAPGAQRRASPSLSLTLQWPSARLGDMC